MKAGPTKSVTMKLGIKTTPYFAAYPLKALNLSAQATTNNNHKSNIHPKRLSRRLRISPMINPYFEKKVSINNIKLPDHIHPVDDDWFNHYE
jgi:hypothetical protein